MNPAKQKKRITVISVCKAMASINDSSIKFFSKASSDQWLFVLSQYKEVFKVRAQATRGSKKSGPQEAIKLDNWYQEELPKILQSRKDKHVRHEELVQITKWKLWRTKNRAGLLDLVRMNTELAVKQVSTKAFKKCPTNLQGAISALVNLKGIGVATASAILCACFPEVCPFMADECLDSVPGIENTNYTVNEFIAFADQIKACCERLQAEDPTAKWTPHKVELTLWTHYWIKEMKLNLLEKMPSPEGLDDEVEETGSDDVKKSKSNGDSHKLSSTSSTNGSGGGAGGNGEKVLDEDSNISVPVSNASEVEEGKSNEEDEEDDDSRSGDVARRNNGTSRNMSKNNNLHMINNSNTNSSSAYNCIDDSNLSYSNLSSDDLNNSTTENTVDNTLDGPTNLTTTSNSNTTGIITTTTNNLNNVGSSSSSNSNSNSNNNNTSNNNSNGNCSSSSSNVSTTTSMSPLAPPPPPPVATAVAVEMSLGECESISTTNNGHVDVNSNGENCKNTDRNNEIGSETVCSSMDDVVPSNSIKRPIDEISSTGDELEDGSIDKKTRIE